MPEERKVMEFGRHGKMGMSVMNRSRTRTVDDGTEDGRKVAIRVSMKASDPKTEEGRGFVMGLAGRYLNVMVAKQLPVFDGLVEDDLSLDQFEALDGQTIDIDIDAVAAEWLSRERKRGGSRLAAEYRHVADIVRAAKTRKGDVEGAKLWTASHVKKVYDEGANEKLVALVDKKKAELEADDADV